MNKNPDDYDVLLIDNSDVFNQIFEPFLVKIKEGITLPDEFTLWIKQNGKEVKGGYEVPFDKLLEMTTFFPQWLNRVGWVQGEDISDIKP